MPRLGRKLGLVILLALAVPAWAQTVHYAVPAASIQDDFAAYHQALDTAADTLLSSVSKQADVGGQTATAATNSPAGIDPAALHQFAQQYWNGNDEAVRRAIERVEELRPVLAPILQEGSIPEEIAGLIVIESAGLQSALSPKGARGIWQFMPDTARRYGLTINRETDDRLNVRKSTVAAIRYLSDLHAQFGDWPLALAAYNAGPESVRKATSKTGAKDFEELRKQGLLPAETREYVPAAFAAGRLLGSTDLVGNRGSNNDQSLWVLYANSAAGGQR
jgi:membrane-bound lytic murein transglycosylase D